jgi:hypothetical protein
VCVCVCVCVCYWEVNARLYHLSHTPSPLDFSLLFSVLYLD